MSTCIVCPPRSKHFMSMRGRLINTMRSAGVDLIFLLPKDDATDEETKLLHGLGFKVYTAPFTRNNIGFINNIYYLLVLFTICIKHRPNSIISFTLKPIVFSGIVGAICKVRNRIGIFTGFGHVLGTMLDRKQTSRKFVKFFINFVFKYSTTIVVQNEDDRKLALSFVSSATKVVKVNGSGVDLSRFTYEPLPNLPIKFLYVGRFTKKKGVADLMEAYQQLVCHRLDFELVLVGSNPSEDEVKKEYITGISRGNIKVYEYTKNIEKHIRESHVLILPSYREGTPRSIIEGFAVGRPCIVTDVPGCSQLVPNEEIGTLVEVRDPEALAIAMENTIINSGKLEKMAKSCRRWAENSYSDIVVNRTIAALVVN